MSFYVPSTPGPTRHRSHSYSQPVPMVASSYPYPTTPYGYNNTLPLGSNYYDSPGYNSSQTYYVAPSISGRSRSHSRPRHSHGHGHSSHGHSHRRSHSHHRQHGHQRRSHSNA